MNRALMILAAVFAVAVFTLANTLFTVQQTEQVLVVQLGRPVRPLEQPGLYTKLPFIQNVISFDRRLLTIELPGEEVILGDQRRLIVDSFTVFHIDNPLLYYQSVGGTATVGVPEMITVVGSKVTPAGRSGKTS